MELWTAIDLLLPVEQSAQHTSGIRLSSEYLGKGQAHFLDTNGFSPSQHPPRRPMSRRNPWSQQGSF